VAQGSLITVNHTAQGVDLLNQKLQVSNALSDGVLQTIMEAKENFGPLKELFELLAMISQAVQAVFSKNAVILLAVSAFMVASVISISCCFGVLYGYYLTVVYCKLICRSLIFRCKADGLIVQAVALALVVCFVPVRDWAALALGNPLTTSSLLGIMALTGLMLDGNRRHRLLCALRLRRIPQPTPPPMVKLPGTMRWVPITSNEVSTLAQQSRRQELHRSKRAQTTPPRL
jgi:hypothetical protein